MRCYTVSTMLYICWEASRRKPPCHHERGRSVARPGLLAPVGIERRPNMCPACKLVPDAFHAAQRRSLEGELMRHPEALYQAVTQLAARPYRFGRAATVPAHPDRPGAPPGCPRRVTAAPPEALLVCPSKAAAAVRGEWSP